MRDIEARIRGLQSAVDHLRALADELSFHPLFGRGPKERIEIFAGSLIEMAFWLVRRFDLQPSVVLAGYKKGAEVALKTLEEITIKSRYGPMVVPGGGASEAEISEKLRRWLTEYGLESPIEQYAFLIFADALEEIPAQLASSIGLDTFQTLVKLRSKHRDGKVWYGINSSTHTVEDLKEIVEPAEELKQVIQVSTEAVAKVLVSHRTR